jgi:hypothetical protein
MEPQPAPQKHVVAIIDDGSSSKIAPAETLARTGDVVAFCNLTSGKVIVMFPDGGLFGDTAYPIDSQKSISLPVSAAALPRSYEYTAYSEATKQFAHASIPRIIIYTEPT